MSEKTKILYQLITADGIKSELREMDNFMPSIFREPIWADSYQIGISANIDNFVPIQAREYKAVDRQEAIIVTYKETK